MITIFTQGIHLSVHQFVCPSQNFKIKWLLLSAGTGTVGWLSGSLMTPVLFLLHPLKQSMCKIHYFSQLLAFPTFQYFYTFSLFMVVLLARLYDLVQIALCHFKVLLNRQVISCLCSMKQSRGRFCRRSFCRRGFCRRGIVSPLPVETNPLMR